MPSSSSRKSKGNAPETKHSSGPKPRTRSLRGRFASTQSSDNCLVERAVQSFDANNLGLAADLVEDPTTTIDDKLERIRALHARWKYEDTEEVLDGDALKTRQRSRCREIGLIVFGFTLHEAQIDAICTLFYDQRDLLLLAKTGFGKSLIFQLLPFMPPATGVVLVLMPLKLLQAEQSALINKIPRGKAIVLNGENNQKDVQLGIARGDYSHVFTSPEIALSKKFKKNVLDHSQFTDRLCLLAVDEIHLVDEWGKGFRPLYAEIEKVRKRIPCHVPLLGVSATLTKKVRLRVVEKAGFLPNYRLMQTSLDRAEIMQIHRFMEHAKSSCLDLQFVLPKVATKASDIQKTIIFVNTLTEIRPIILIFQEWMIKLGYPEESWKWIRPYYSAISEWDKTLTANAFQISGDENTECTILVATDAYGMGIDNPDVKLVIQWDIPLSFDSMIQRMGRAGRKGGQSTFVFFTPKWSRIKDPKEIEKRQSKNSKSSLDSGVTTANAQLSNSNRPKAPKPSPLSQVLSADANTDAEDISESESVVGSDADFDIIPGNDESMDGLLATDAEKARKKAKKDQQTSRTSEKKREMLADEIFDYIHVARCRRLFSLAWYDDLTYAEDDVGWIKPLPVLCCNGPSCLSLEPDFMQREPFIEASSIKTTKIDREWIACRTLELKKWRKQTAIDVWRAKKVEEDMPDSLIMPDDCLLALAKSGASLNHDQLVEFLKPWYGMAKHADGILIVLQKNRPHLDTQVSPPFELPSRSERKSVLVALRTSKKLKNMDDPAVAEEARMTELRDKWLIKRGKATPETKARMKKAAAVEKKLLEKQDKAKAKNQGLNVKRLALTISQAGTKLGAFKEILSDPPTGNEFSHLPDTSNNDLPTRNPSVLSSNAPHIAARIKNAQKKKSMGQMLANRVNCGNAPTQAKENTRRLRAPTPPPVSMELIRPGKRKVQIPANAVESTPQKCMRQAIE